MSSDEFVHSPGPSRPVEPGEQVLAPVSSDADPLKGLPPVVADRILIVSAAGPSAIDRALCERGLDPERAGLVPVTTVTLAYDGPLSVAERVDPSDLTGLSMVCSRGLAALPRESGLLVVDSLDTLCVFDDRGQIVPFLEHLANQARDRGVRGVYALVRETVGPDTYLDVRRALDREVDVSG